MIAGENYAVGVSGLRGMAERNWAQIEGELAQLRNLFDYADTQLERIGFNAEHTDVP